MNTRNLIVAFLLGALVAGGAVWMGIRYTRAAAAVDPIPRAGGDVASAADEGLPSGALPARRSADDPELVGAPSAPARFEDLQEENRELKGKVEELEAQIEVLRPKPRDPRAFRFGVPRQAQVFDKAEWPTLAGHMKELTATLAELKDTVTAGGQPSQAQIARIVKHNTPLATFAVGFGSDIGDGTANGAYTHPAVIANLMRAALAEASLPLTDEQEIAIQALGNAWIGEQERVVAGFPADAPIMGKTVQEVDAKLRFLASAQTVLTGAQRSVLFPPETAGRLKLDLLSPALVYVLSFPVQASDAADMEKKLLGQLFAQAGVAMEDLEPYAWIGREWVDAIPGVTNPQRETSIDLVFPHVDQVQLRARAQAAAIERVLAMGGLTDTQEASLRSVQSLLYPFVLVGGG